MKNQKINQSMTYKRKKTARIGKFFILFVVCCFFGSLVFLASALSNFLSIKNWALFSSACSISATTVYCVSFGEYDSENAALVQCEYIKEKGGAGLIYKNNDKYTILLSGYLDKQSCQNVYDKNIETFNQLKQISINLNSKKFEHSKTAKDISVLENIVQLPVSVFNKLHEISNNLDAGNITSQQAFNALFNISYDINNVIENFQNTSGLTSQQDYNSLVQNAKNIYSKVNNIILNSSKSELSWKIKYCSLDVILLAS